MTEKTQKNYALSHSPLLRRGSGGEETSACLPVDFAELVSQSIENMRYFIGADNVTIESSVTDTKNFVGSNRLLSIILNSLITNGIKHRKTNIDNAYVKVTVHADNQKAIIHVADNGIGIKAGDENKIFDLFYRTNKNDYGTGLGLYLVKEIIAKLKGKIMVESAQNAGTEITVEIPNHNATSNVLSNDNIKKYFE